MLALSLFLLFAAIVAAVALALLRLEVALVAVASLQLVDALLKLAKMQLQVFVNLAHLKVLLLEVLPTLGHLVELLGQIQLGHAQRRHFLLRLDQLVRSFSEFLLKLVQSGQLVLLDHVEVVLELELLLEHQLEAVSELVQITLRLALVSQCDLGVALLLDHLQFELGLPLEQRRHLFLGPLQRVNPVVQLIDLSRLVTKLCVLEFQVLSARLRIAEVLFEGLVLDLEQMDQMCLIVVFFGTELRLLDDHSGTVVVARIDRPARHDLILERISMHSRALVHNAQPLPHVTVLLLIIWLPMPLELVCA